MSKNTESKRAGRKAGQGSKWIRLSTRLSIYHRDAFCCAYCGKSAEEHGVGLTLDHIVACENGGTNVPSNLVTACGACNSTKQDLTIRAWYLKLRDAGIDTTPISRRIRRLVNTEINRAEGRRLAAVRTARKNLLKNVNKAFTVLHSANLVAAAA